MPEPTGLIYPAMASIMADVAPIGKDRRNAEQKYQFRGIDDVYNAVQPLLAKHGVSLIAEVKEHKREERPSKSGGILSFTTVVIRYSFFARDGSSVITEAVGEGMDSGDKSTAKAMSMAQKIAILQAFCIPTAEAKDAENDNPEPAQRQQQPAPTSAAAANTERRNFLVGKIIELIGLLHMSNDDVKARNREKCNVEFIKNYTLPQLEVFHAELLERYDGSQPDAAQGEF